MELEQMKNQLLQWFWKGYFTNKYKEEDCILIEKGFVKLKLFTDTNVYTIVARQRPEVETDYLGCVASSRKPRAGETWTRGNDLPDGPFCYETWVKIIAAIVGYELVKIQAPIKRVADEG